MFGNAAGSVPEGSIEQISSQIGGFSAKYGNAQSAIVNAVTKSGTKNYFGGLEAVSSNFTDPYNYNSIAGNFGGPVIPGSNIFDFFVSGDYIKTDDIRPRASGLTIPSVNIDTDALPNMEGDILRFSGKLTGRVTDNLKITASGNASFRDSRQFIMRYAKNASEHFPKIEEDVMGASLKLSQVFDETAFMDVIARYRDQNYQRADGYWYDNVLAYGTPVKIIRKNKE